MKLDLNKENLIIYGIAAGLGFVVLSVALNGVKGTTKSIASGVVGGVIDAGVGAVQGAYEALPPSVKPTEKDNVINKAFNKQWEFWTGSPTFGGWLYDVTH